MRPFPVCFYIPSSIWEILKDKKLDLMDFINFDKVSECLSEEDLAGLLILDRILPSGNSVGQSLKKCWSFSIEKDNLYVDDELSLLCKGFASLSPEKTAKLKRVLNQSEIPNEVDNVMGRWLTTEKVSYLEVEEAFKIVDHTRPVLGIVFRDDQILNLLQYKQLTEKTHDNGFHNNRHVIGHQILLAVYSVVLEKTHIVGPTFNSNWFRLYVKSL